ncbi:hypothetical protein AB0N19_20195, partial [Streptomyces sp. NPDC051132]
MTGHAHAVVADVQRCVAELPKDDPRAALTEVVLGEAAGRLSQPFTGTMACVQHRARLARPVRDAGTTMSWAVNRATAAEGSAAGPAAARTRRAR